jgi:hypothetical protein
VELAGLVPTRRHRAIGRRSRRDCLSRTRRCGSGRILAAASSSLSVSRTALDVAVVDRPGDVQNYDAAAVLHEEEEGVAAPSGLPQSAASRLERGSCLAVPQTGTGKRGD